MSKYDMKKIMDNLKPIEGLIDGRWEIPFGIETPDTTISGNVDLIRGAVGEMEEVLNRLSEKYGMDDDESWSLIFKALRRVGIANAFLDEIDNLL